jgi:hypothetical protein
MENDRDILLIAIFTFFTVFAWIFFELVQTSKTSTIAQSTQNLLVPLETNIDSNTLSALEKKSQYK